MGSLKGLREGRRVVTYDNSFILTGKQTESMFNIDVN